MDKRAMVVSNVVLNAINRKPAMNHITPLLCMILSMAWAPCALCGPDLEQSFGNPPDAAKPWVYWFWVNGNITKEGITKDWESFKRVGIGGLVNIHVAGKGWAPDGPAGSDPASQLEMLEWTATEAKRLGLHFAMAIDFGYGSGGPHITPDLSMQKLYWSETSVKGGRNVTLELPMPSVGKQKSKGGASPASASYRDVAVFAIPAEKNGGLFPAAKKKGPNSVDEYTGLGWATDLAPLTSSAPTLSKGEIIDLSSRMDGNGKLQWDAPKGDWIVIRLGHGTNFKTTRPCPAAATGLECDRLNPQGIEKHFDYHLKHILEALKANKVPLEYAWIDSWEARGQNWSEGFADEFEKRRGYDPRPWLPVLLDCVVESTGKSERFLWDLRQTVSEVILGNYIDLLRELIKPYGTKLACEPYGQLCVNTLDYAGRADFPVGEFWASRSPPKTPGTPATFSDYWYNSMKGLASVANTYGKARVGAEAFTSGRGWCDHPFLLKGMGDEAFSQGVSHYIFHCSAHQPYDNMKPGMTHRIWGQHFNRHQTWWEYSGPYMTYVARCQTLLQQGLRAVDSACFYHEGAPLNFNDIEYHAPDGHDFDFCSADIIQRMKVEGGRIVLPTGVTYRYLEVVPDRLTLPTAQKIESLRKAGARVYTRSTILGTPGLAGFPDADIQVKNLAASWPMLPKGGLGEIMARDNCLPDFEGGELKWIHRITPDADIYFVANVKYEPASQECLFRNEKRTPDLWDPETGDRFKIPFERRADGRVAVNLQFSPAQSWFVVFQDAPTASKVNPFPVWKPVQTLAGPWKLSFDPAWGTDKTLTLDKFASWTENSDPLVKYYSGTAAYRTSFKLDKAPSGELSLDLGRVEVMARIFVNGKDCGIAWKAPYRVVIAGAAKAGTNDLEIRVVNTWVNRLVGDEQLPLDADWKGGEFFTKWPDWFLKSPAGRYTFTTARHYDKDSPLQVSGLIGPVKILSQE